MPRFIVLTNLLSSGKPRWRHGTVLADGGARALVRITREDVIEVTAIGPEQDRLRLLEIIQGNLDRIHRDLPDPKPVAEVELAGQPNVFRPVEDLKAAEAKKQDVAMQTNAGPVLVKPTLELDRTSEREARDGSRVPLHTFLSYSHRDDSMRRIFHDNLTVMEQKQFIRHWHDGLIEPGMLWQKEIDDGLERMEIFVGLLTTAYLVSKFIQQVELKKAREKRRAQGRDFLFVLILVEDVSLVGLDLAEYQILKPGGKAIMRHSSRRAGFNVAQKELEQLCIKLQESKRGRQEPMI
jgi:hypothetical protein